jgi:putative PIN family toxin of toxin-antitoxin system
LVFGGVPLRLIHLAIDGELEVAISEPILEETVRVLRQKFGWPIERLDAAQGLIRSFAVTVKPSRAVDVMQEDPADNRILECAAESRSQYIVTGDKDLHRLGQYGNSLVLRPSAMLDILQPKNPRTPYHE